MRKRYFFPLGLEGVSHKWMNNLYTITVKSVHHILHPSAQVASVGDSYLTARWSQVPVKKASATGHGYCAYSYCAHSHYRNKRRMNDSIGLLIE